MMESNLKKTSVTVLTAMMLCIIMVAIFVLRIPIPFTQGYVNLSDGIIFIAIGLLDKKHSVAAASLGSMMGDIIGGFAMQFDNNIYDARLSNKLRKLRQQFEKNVYESKL